MSDRQRGPQPKLDAFARVRDFHIEKRPRLTAQPTGRRLDNLERMARDNESLALDALMGSSVVVYDSLPDAQPSDLGRLIWVRGAAGEPSRAWQGALSQNDAVQWEPVTTQAFYGAATEFLDEFYSLANWTFSGSSQADEPTTNLGHPGVRQINTGAVSGNAAFITTGRMRLGDIERAAFIAKPAATITSYIWRIGFGDTTDTATMDQGLYVEKLSGEADFRVVKMVGSVATRTATTITMSGGNWYLFQFAYNGIAGSFTITITDLSGAEGTAVHVLTGVTETVGVVPFLRIETATSAGRSADIDYFWIRHRSTVRS